MNKKKKTKNKRKKEKDEKEHVIEAPSEMAWLFAPIEYRHHEL